MVMSASAVAEVYKCTVNGKTVYADSPCDNKATVVPITRGSAPVESGAARTDWATLKTEMDRRSSVRAAIDAGAPLVSMSRQELNDAMGSPDKVNTSDYGRGIEEQLIYSRNGRTIYVYTKNSVVTAIQNTEGYSQKRKPCPTPYEIRDLKMEASKYMNRDTEYGKSLEKKLLKQ